MKQLLGWLAGGVAAAGVVGVAIMATQDPRPQEVPPAGATETPQAAEPPAQSAVAAAEEAVEEAVPADPDPAQAEPDSVAADAPPEPLPRLTDLRIEPDGMTVLAGHAAGDETVAILIDGDEAARATAAPDGQFATVLVLGPSSRVRVLTLRADPDGSPRDSADSVMIAPTETAEVAVVPETAPVAEGAAEDPAGEVLAAAPAQAVEQPGLLAAQAADAAGDRPAVAEATPVVSPEAPAAPATAPQAAPPVSAPEVVALAAAPDVAAPATAPQAAPQVSAPEVAALAAAPEVTAPATVPQAAPPVSAPEVAALATAPEVAVPPAVDAPAVAAVLVSDDSGVRLAQPAIAAGATPEVVSSVALDMISYDQTGQVVLSGRAKGAAVRVYLDNAVKADAPVGAQGWQAVLGDVAPGVYTIRIDEIDATGAVSSRIETPFLREAPEAVAAAMADEAGITGVAMKTVQPGHTLWAIARERYGEGIHYVEVFAANRDRIRNPDLIYPGQVFVLPDPVAAE